MKYLIIIAVIVILLTPLFALAARFDWVLGKPTVVDDGVVPDTFEQIKYDWVLGTPTQVYDTTAIPPVPSGATTSPFVLIDSSIIFSGSILIP